MTWEEYKKKNKITQNSTSNVGKQRQIAPISNSNTNKKTTSSWEEYKKKNNITQQVKSEQKNTNIAPINNVVKAGIGSTIKSQLKEESNKLTAEEIAKLQAGDKETLKKVKLMSSVTPQIQEVDKTGELRTLSDNSKFKNKNGKLVLEEDGFFKSNGNNILQKTLGTAADVGLNIGKGIANIGENVGDLMSYGVAGVSDLIGQDEYADRLRQNAQRNLVDEFTQPAQKELDKYSVLGNKSKEVAQGLGYVAGNTAISMFAGGLAPISAQAKASTIASMSTTFASSMGGGMTEAYQEGANDGEAFAYGLVSGLGETGSELLFGGLGKASKATGLSKGIGGLDDQIAVGLTKPIKNKMAKTLIQAGVKSAGEGAEEVVSGFISAVAKKATYMKDEDFGKLVKDQNLWEQFCMGALTSAIAEAPSVGVSIKNGTDYVTLDYEDSKNKPDLAENRNNIEEQQTILNNNDTTQNQNMEQITNNNVNDINYYESAKKYNIDTNNELVQSIARVTDERGIKARYDANIFTDTTQSAIWKVSKDENGNTIREVIINPNADTKKSLESIVVHELTHDLEGTKEYNELKELILNYDKGKIGFEESRQALENLYSTVYDKNSVEFNELVNNEAVADILGSKLGDQNFINNLNTQNKTLAQRLYSWVVDKLNKINKLTGYKSEKLYWTDVKNKFENAFKQNYSINENSNTKFSIQQDQNGNKYVKVDTDQDVFEGIDSKDYNKIAKMYIQDYLMGETKLSNDEQAIIDKRSANKYTNPGKRQQNFDKKMKLTPELRNVLEVAKIDKTSLPTKENSKYQSWEYYKFNFELSGKKFEGTVNIGIDNNGNKHFYEINKIKEIDDILGTSLNRSSTSSINNSIAPINQSVNTNNKYSMQESENNAWQNRLDTLYKNKNKGTTIEDIKNKGIAPPAKNNKSNIDTNKNIDQKPKKMMQEKNWNNNTDNFSNTTRYIETNLNIPTKEYFDNIEYESILTDADYEVLNKIYEKEGRTEVLTEKKKAKILEKYANDKFAIKDSLDVMAQKFINKGHYIDKLAQQSNNLELKYAYDRTLNSFAEGQYVIGVAQTDNKGKKVGKSITEIWEPVKKSGLTKEFSEYLLHKHNVDRSGKNKYVFGKEIGPTESTAIALELENKHPEFKKYAEDIKKYNHNFLNSLKETGMLTQDTIDYIEALYPNYVVISRTFEDSLYVGDKEKTGAIAPLRRATGGNSDIQPIEDAMAQQALRIKRLVNQNEFGKQLAKSLKNAQIDEGVDISLAPTMIMEMDTMVDTDTSGNKYYIYFEDGKQKKLKITDELYESLKPTEISKLEKTLPVKALQKVTSIHRNLLTSNNPLFIVTNFFKDFQDGIFNSKYSSKFIKNYGKALNEIHIKGKYYESYMANGGGTNTYFDYESGMKKRKSKFVEKIRNANEYVEQLPRLAEFISTIEDGKSLNEALYNAAEITTNFKRGGDITKALNRNGANFLNASVQGLDKQFRNLKGQNGIKGYVNLLAKAVTIGVLPSVLNHILLDDDEDYQDLPQSTKDLYYLFKYGNGKFIRIPKGRVISIFGSAARRTLETVEGRDDAWEGFKDTVVNQVAPNNPLEDNILAPIVQVKSNKTWYGGDLVSSRLLKELPKNQYDETTDEFSKWLGSKLNMSPKKINYLIDQYSGGIGDIVLPYITPQAKKNPIVDKFTTDSVLKNKNVSKFYETLEKQTQIANDNFATDEDELQLKYLNGISKEMSGLYKEKRQIQMSKISNKEKSEQVREIQTQINELAEKGLKNYRDVSKGESFAKTDNQEYYKNSKGEWSTLTEEEQEKNKNISIETYSDYKQKVYKKTEEQRKEGEISEKQQLKDKDKIQILLDSKYSKKEIREIYENYIKSNNDKKYDIMKKTGIDINEYLKYKQQDFESDVKDNGTTKGKSVSGSAKKKVYEYVNNMNITYEQRLLLLGTQYKLTDTERTKVYNYVKSLNYTQDEMQKVFESLKGFTVYKDGRVTW